MSDIYNPGIIQLTSKNGSVTFTPANGEGAIVDLAATGGGGGSGTVTSVSVVTANGISGTVATDTTTPAITLALGAITPASVNSVVLSGSSTPTLAVTGTSSISGSNTGDQTITLTGDVTGSGTGSFATTVVHAPASGITGTTLASNVVTTSVTAVGALASGSLTTGFTAVAVAQGGTGGTSASITLFNNITGYTASGATGTTSTNLVFSASPTFTGTAIVAAQTNSGILYLNGGVAEEAVYSNGNSGTSLALNLDNGNLQSATITGAVTITMTTPTHPGKFSVVLTQDGSGHTYSFTGVKWVGGTQPTWSTAASAIDIASFIYDGSHFFGTGGTGFA